MSVDDFVAARKTYREELGRHEAELMTRLKELDDVLWDRPFSEGEKAQRKSLVEELVVVHREQFFLLEADIREFDSQRRIADLTAHFERLGKDMKRRQAKLEQLIGAIKTGTKVLQALEKMTQKLADLLV
jgi:hypothetical protein